MAGRASNARERGATLVEYALGVALVVAVCVLALQTIQDRAEAKNDQTAADLTDGGTTGGSTTGGSTGGSTGGPVTPAAISSSCSGATCQLSITGAPAGSTVSWTTSPDVGNGAGSTFSITGQKNGGPYSVTATIQPGGQTAHRTVSCTNGNNPVCTAS